MLVLRIQGFWDAVRVEQKALTGLEAQFVILVLGIGRNELEGKPFAMADVVAFRAGSADMERRIVPGRAVGDGPALSIADGVERREALDGGEVLVKMAIYSLEQARGLLVLAADEVKEASGDRSPWHLPKPEPMSQSVMKWLMSMTATWRLWLKRFPMSVCVHLPSRLMYQAKLM